ncbi:MAG: cysteine peptidase family C39 domain-containing protein [Candidatus Muirbacterium halophilum]|nr:cysteine peptidase family C39 domain-containing protein [Candidatus Muirbacterium halophilum]MCK9475158.1 cysteine peptidase family C39 domain-containing protein [Candidatus Muirbacterium halophilum]
MSGKRLIFVIIFILSLLYVYLFYTENFKKNQLINHNFERFSFSPPVKTPYNGFIIRKMNQFRQSEDYTCGPATARYFLSLSGIHVNEKKLGEIMDTDSYKGTNLKSIQLALEKYGLFLKGVKGDISIFKNPCIIQMKYNHFVVFLKKSFYDDNFFIFDPEFGEVFLFKEDFLKLWSGYALIQ